MTGEQAVAYGLIDGVLAERAETGSAGAPVSTGTR